MESGASFCLKLKLLGSWGLLAGSTLSTSPSWLLGCGPSLHAQGAVNQGLSLFRVSSMFCAQICGLLVHAESFSRQLTGRISEILKRCKFRGPAEVKALLRCWSFANERTACIMRIKSPSPLMVLDGGCLKALDALHQEHQLALAGLSPQYGGLKALKTPNHEHQLDPAVAA